MILSENEILRLSGEIGFRPFMLEKVLYLIQLLQSLNKHPFLKGKWVLKGGTAIYSSSTCPDYQLILISTI